MSVPGSIVGTEKHALFMDTAFFYDADSRGLMQFSQSQFKSNPTQFDYSPVAAMTFIDDRFINIIVASTVLYQAVEYQIVSLQVLIDALDSIPQGAATNDARNKLTNMQECLILAHKAAREGLAEMGEQLNEQRNAGHES